VSEEKPDMAGRIGDALYGLGCSAAALIVYYVAFVIVGADHPAWGLLRWAIGAAGMFWLMGRLARYLLKGD
jgi:hypothetical protein